jgi:dynein heavy chain
MDKRLIEAIISVFIHSDVVDKGPDYKFSNSGIYYCPVATTQDEFLAYLKTLPITPSPEIFGLHENCELTCAESEAMQLLEDIMSTTPRTSGGGGKSADEVMDEMAVDIEKQTPEPFNLDDMEEAYPTKYEESRNTVLKQESLKFNRLIFVLKEQVPVFRKALKGFVAMTEDLEAIGKGLYMNMVPDSWAAVSFLSMKPLIAWMKDLNARVDFMRHWVDHDNPIAFWISGLFFPQAFLTATLQNFARSQQIAIDRLTFDFTVHDEWELDGSNLKEHADCGSYCWGMFLEGCRWDSNIHALGPSLPKQLFVQFPLVHFVPMTDRKGCPPGYYPCPVYRVLSRKGTLSTTGHSTNFVLDMDVPSVDEPDAWIRAGVAAFLSLKY